MQKECVFTYVNRGFSGVALEVVRASEQWRYYGEVQNAMVHAPRVCLTQASAWSAAMRTMKEE